MNTFTNDANACSVVSVHPNKDAFAVVLEINSTFKGPDQLQNIIATCCILLNGSPPPSQVPISKSGVAGIFLSGLLSIGTAPQWGPFRDFFVGIMSPFLYLRLKNNICVVLLKILVLKGKCTFFFFMLQWNKYTLLSQNRQCREYGLFWSRLDSDLTQMTEPKNDG